MFTALMEAKHRRFKIVTMPEKGDMFFTTFACFMFDQTRQKKCLKKNRSLADHINTFTAIVKRNYGNCQKKSIKVTKTKTTEIAFHHL